MSRGKKPTAEQILGKLREAEIFSSKGHTQQEAAKQIGVTYQTYCRWRKSTAQARLSPHSCCQAFPNPNLYKGW